MSEKKPATILVRSKSERFRRAGIEFTRQGAEIDPSTLTPEQAELINDEPMLSIDGGEIEGTAEPVKTKAKRSAK